MGEIMSTPKVSVVIPIWNTEKYLEKCLDSIINQTLKDIEIICVNNGSTDRSGLIIEQYAKKDPRIKVIKIEHKCLSGVRNVGLSAASAPYIAFVDSDDWLEADVYENAVKHFENDSDIDIVCWGANIIKENSNVSDSLFNGARKYHKIRLKGKKELNNKIILLNTVCVWNKMFKADIIKGNKIMFPEGLELEDNSFYYTYIVNCKYGYFINKYFYNYRQRENSLIRQIQASKTTIVAPHLKNLNFIMDYYKNKKILTQKCALILELLSRYLEMDMNWTAEKNHPEVLNTATILAEEIPDSDSPLLENLKNKNYTGVLKIIKNEPEKIYGNKIFTLYRKNNGMYQLNMFNKKILKFKLRRKG